VTDVVGERRKLCRGELYGMHSSKKIISVQKCKKIKLTWHCEAYWRYQKCIHNFDGKI